MYNEYFHFSEQPFSIAPDPHFIFMSTRHQEGLAHLLYGINYGGGFVALTGEVGTGKTTLCHCLLQQLPENIEIALILNPKMNALELLATICDELRIKYDAQQPALKSLVDALNQHLLDAHAKGKRTVLVIDEAQNLSLEVLEQIRLLTNLETSKTKLLQIILVGQPELQDLLHRSELRQLNQRITARYHLLPLSLSETKTYIRHRLAKCKGDPNVFTDQAINKIFKYSDGIPRVINIICHSALLGAYSTDTRTITPTIIKRAAKETLAFTNGKNALLIPFLTALALFGMAFGGYHWYNHTLNNMPQNSDFRLSATQATAKVPKSTLPVKISPNQVVSAQQAALQAAPPKPKAPPPSKPVEKPIAFNAWLANSELTLNAGIANAIKLWGKALPADTQADCESVTVIGLNCQFGKGSWKDILGYNQPVILEFSLPSGLKRHGLLTAIRDSQPVLSDGHDKTFPLADVLGYWDGYYLLLWQYPRPGLSVISPGQTSAHVEWLRQQLDAVDGNHPKTDKPLYFDQDLKKRVIQFQTAHQLSPDGKVGIQTIFYLDSATGAKGSPHLRQD